MEVYTTEQVALVIEDIQQHNVKWIFINIPRKSKLKIYNSLYIHVILEAMPTLAKQVISISKSK